MPCEASAEFQCGSPGTKFLYRFVSSTKTACVETPKEVS